MKVECPFCRRKIEVIDPGTSTPWLKRHRVGKAADVRGGQTRKTRCIGSMMGVRRDREVKR